MSIALGFLFFLGPVGWVTAQQQQSLPPPPQTTILPNASPHSFRFVAFGDMGDGSQSQLQIAQALKTTWQAHPFSLALMLGDNIYPVGDIQRYAQKRFIIPYQFLLSHDVRFMPVLGNHDIILHPSGNSEVKFFNMPGHYYDFIDGDVHFFAIDTQKFNHQQQTWLKAALARSTSPWTVVYGHYPVFSSGDHGSTPELEKDLEPILENSHVDVYLCGHDHDYERFEAIKGVHYIVSGGGGAELRNFETPQPASLVRLKAHHFLLLTLNGETMTIQAINASGQIIDTQTIQKSGVAHS